MKLLIPAILLSLCTFTACVSAPVVRDNASTTRFAIEVSQNTLFAPSVQDDVKSHFQSALLKSRAGIPVVDRSQADLIVKVNISGANFTAVTAWDWQIIDPDTGAIVMSDTDTSAFGASGEAIATDVVNVIATIDTAPYAKANNGVIVASALQSQSEIETPASSTDGSNAWAVIIGIENYRESLPAATGAESDATAFADLAKNTLNVPESNIKLLKGDRATRSDMTAALFEWLPRNAVKPGGRVYVFFSGHGAPEVETGSAYLVPYDANPTYIKSGGLKVNELQEKLSALSNQNVYVFLDACFSGQGDRSVLAEGTRPIVPVKEITPKGRVVTFSASGATETTGAHKGGKHGLFSYYVLTGVGGAADTNGDRNVTTTEIADYLMSTVPAAARLQNREQTPTATNAKGQMIVRGLQN